MLLNWVYFLQLESYDEYDKFLSLLDDGMHVIMCTPASPTVGTAFSHIGSLGL